MMKKTSNFEPLVLDSGTEVSAKYKGAFCEAKIKKVNRLLKFKIRTQSNTALTICENDIISSGPLHVGYHINFKYNNNICKAIITQIQDQSEYTVVFDDGDEVTLKRTSLCLKSGKHYDNESNYNQLAFNHPERFVNPIRKCRRVQNFSPNVSMNQSLKDNDSDNSKNNAILKKQKRKLKSDVGKVVCVEYGDKRGFKNKDVWFPAYVVCVTILDSPKFSKENVYFKVRSFRDDRYYEVCKRDANPFEKEKINLNMHSYSPELKIAVEKALRYIETSKFPSNWDHMDEGTNKIELKCDDAKLLNAKHIHINDNIDKDDENEYDSDEDQLESNSEEDDSGESMIHTDTEEDELKDDIRYIENLKSNKKKTESLRCKDTDSLKTDNEKDDHDNDSIDADNSNISDEENDAENDDDDNENDDDDDDEENEDENDDDDDCDDDNDDNDDNDDDEDEDEDEEDEEDEDEEDVEKKRRMKKCEEERDMFVAKWYKCMEDRGTPINKCLTVNGEEFDIYNLYRFVNQMGGLHRLNKNDWLRILKELKISTVQKNEGTSKYRKSAVFQLKSIYKEYLQPFHEINRKLGLAPVLDSKFSIKKHRPLRANTKSHKQSESKSSSNQSKPSSSKSANKSSKYSKNNSSNIISKDKTEIDDDKIYFEIEDNYDPDLICEKIGDNEMLKLGLADQFFKNINNIPVSIPGDIETQCDDVKELVKMHEEIEAKGLNIGDTVSVYYGIGEQMSIYTAKIIDIHWHEYRFQCLVHYSGWTSRYDEWIDIGRLFSISRAKKTERKKRINLSDPDLSNVSEPKKEIPSDLSLRKSNILKIMRNQNSKNRDINEKEIIAQYKKHLMQRTIDVLPDLTSILKKSNLPESNIKSESTSNIQEKNEKQICSGKKISDNFKELAKMVGKSENEEKLQKKEKEIKQDVIDLEMKEEEEDEDDNKIVNVKIEKDKVSEVENTEAKLEEVSEVAVDSKKRKSDNQIINSSTSTEIPPCCSKMIESDTSKNDNLDSDLSMENIDFPNKKLQKSKSMTVLDLVKEEKEAKLISNEALTETKTLTTVTTMITTTTTLANKSHSEVLSNKSSNSMEEKFESSRNEWNEKITMTKKPAPSSSIEQTALALDTVNENEVVKCVSLNERGTESDLNVEQSNEKANIAISAETVVADLSFEIDHDSPGQLVVADDEEEEEEEDHFKPVDDNSSVSGDESNELMIDEKMSTYNDANDNNNNNNIDQETVENVETKTEIKTETTKGMKIETMATIKPDEDVIVENENVEKLNEMKKVESTITIKEEENDLFSSVLLCQETVPASPPCSPKVSTPAVVQSNNLANVNIQPPEYFMQSTSSSSGTRLPLNNNEGENFKDIALFMSGIHQSSSTYTNTNTETNPKLNQLIQAVAVSKENDEEMDSSESDLEISDVDELFEEYEDLGPKTRSLKQKRNKLGASTKNSSGHLYIQDTSQDGDNHSVDGDLSIIVTDFSDKDNKSESKRMLLSTDNKNEEDDELSSSGGHKRKKDLGAGIHSKKRRRGRMRTISQSENNGKESNNNCISFGKAGKTRGRHRSGNSGQNLTTVNLDESSIFLSKNPPPIDWSILESYTPIYQSFLSPINEFLTTAEQVEIIYARMEAIKKHHQEVKLRQAETERQRRIAEKLRKKRQKKNKRKEKNGQNKNENSKCNNNNNNDNEDNNKKNTTGNDDDNGDEDGDEEVDENEDDNIEMRK